MKLSNFKQWLNKLDNVSLLLVNSPEDYYKTETIARIRKDYPDAEFFSIIADELNQDKIKQIAGDASTLPFFSDKKIFYIRDVDKVSASISDDLIKIISTITDFSIFIFTANALDGRGSLYKKINKEGIVLKEARLYSNECTDWLDYFLKKHAKTMSSDVKEFFLELVGPSLIAMENELKKLVMYVKDKIDIDHNDVSTMLQSIKINTIFDLTDAIGKKDKLGALYLLKNMLEQGTHEILVITMIARHFRILLRIQEKLRKKQDSQSIAKDLKLSPYFIRNYIKQASEISFSEALRFFCEIWNTEFKLKTSTSYGVLHTEQLILGL